ncbi:MAG: hypothetical protein NTV07_00745, partial [Candidatus Omnitrophica bacterium]|nr:hypothetical protein [Candidatus Omnitrophota bacterium]
MMDKIRYSAERTIQAANNLVQPVLQRKSSSGKGSKNSRLSGAQLIDSTQYNVDLTAPGWTNLGNGMISRVIDGVHHIYVEHGSAVTSSTSTIQDAIELMGNSGGIVLVAGGAYSGDISVTNGVKLYGGYDQHGNRNLTASATTIQGTFSVDGTTYADFANTGVPMGTVDAITEINGFTITNDLTAAITIGAHNADKLRILNNDIQYSFRGIYA